MARIELDVIRFRITKYHYEDRRPDRRGRPSHHGSHYGRHLRAAERAQDREQRPQIGRSIDIGGRALNIDCAGSGSPVLISESGAPRPGYTWVFIQHEVPKIHQRLLYDRASFGWSDFGPYPAPA